MKENFMQRNVSSNDNDDMHTGFKKTLMDIGKSRHSIIISKKSEWNIPYEDEQSAT